jgi:COP9 signalosome complex subunit 7
MAAMQVDQSSPLYQFVVLAQSQKGKAVEALVRQVLEHSGIYVFGELLDCPNVQALSESSDGAKLLELLRIFAYGSYTDYKAKAAELGDLTEPQRRKLQLLTLVSAATQEKLIKFDSLASAVDIPVSRELEGLIIDAVYQGLVTGKMDQENQCFIVESCACRDCRPEDIDYIIETLESWYDAANKSMDSLGGMVKFAQDNHEKNKAQREELDKEIQQIKENIKEGELGSKGSGDGGTTRMAGDDADEESKRAKSIRGGRWMGMGASSRDR